MTEYFPAWRRLLGPRSKREATLLQRASKLHRCPHCSRRSIYRAHIVNHMLFAHSDKNQNTDDIACVDRPVLTDDELEQECYKQTAAVILRDVSSFDETPALSAMHELVASNDAEWYHRLDMDDVHLERRSVPVTPILTPTDQQVSFEFNDAVIDYDVTDMFTDDDVDVEGGGGNSGDDMGPMFKCFSCSFTSPRPALVKQHVRKTHSDDSWLTMLDARQPEAVVYYQCFNASCLYFANSKDDLCSHYDSHPGHAPSFINFHRLNEIDKELQTSGSKIGYRAKSPHEQRNSKILKRVLQQHSPVRPPHKSGVRRGEISVTGYVKYNVRTHAQVLNYVPSTAVGGSVDHLCRYCPDFWHKDPTEVNLHQSQVHPNAYPCAVDVKRVVGKQRAEM